MYSSRQQEIIDKSIRLIAAKGIQGFTIKNLSKSVGISEPAIYRHFESKTVILTNILKQFVDLAEFLSEMMGSSPLAAMEKISFMFEKMVSIFTEEPALISIIFSEDIFKNEEKLKTIVTNILNTNEKTVESILKQGQINNEIRKDIDNKYLALLIMGALRLMVKRWDLNDQNFNLKDEGKNMIDSIGKLVLK